MNCSKILTILCLVLFSAFISVGVYHDRQLKKQTIITKIKVYYTNGNVEVVTLKRNASVIYKHGFNNGCLYRQNKRGDYSGTVRCGVRSIKTLEVKKL